MFPQFEKGDYPSPSTCDNLLSCNRIFSVRYVCSMIYCVLYLDIGIITTTGSRGSRLLKKEVSDINKHGGRYQNKLIEKVALNTITITLILIQKNEDVAKKGKMRQRQTPINVNKHRKLKMSNKNGGEFRGYTKSRVYDSHVVPTVLLNSANVNYVKGLARYYDSENRSCYCFMTRKLEQ